MKLTKSTQSIRSLFLTATCLAGMAVAAQAQLITSFESSEGFTSGSTPAAGSAGWAGSTGSASTYFRVTNAQAYSGTQSLMAVNSNPNNNTFFGTSPNLFDLNATSISFYLKHDGGTFAANANIARFELYYHTNGASTTAESSRVIMTLRYGATEGADYALQFSDNGVASTVTRNLVGSAGLDLTNWTNVNVNFNFSNEVQDTVSATVGGFTVNQAANLVAAATEESRIVYLRLAVNTSGTGTTYYDQFTAIPEPSVHLLLVGCAGGLAMFRRRRIR